MRNARHDERTMVRTLKYTSFAVINESKEGRMVECQMCAAASSFTHHRVQFFNVNKQEAQYCWVCASCLMKLRKRGTENI